MSAEEAGRLAREAGVGRLVLIHISDELDAERSRRIAADGVRRRGRGGVRRSRVRGVAPRVPSATMARQRDLLVNIERMRREMDEFLGDSWAAGAALVPLRQRVLAAGRRLSTRGDARRRDASRSRWRSSPPTWPASPPTRSTSRSPAAPWSSPAGARSARRRAAPTSRSRSRPAASGGRSSSGVDVEAERARATFEEGLLRVELPIRIPDRTARKVPIERSEGEPG